MKYKIGDYVEATDFYGNTHKGKIIKIKVQQGRFEEFDKVKYHLENLPGMRFNKENLLLIKE